MKSRKKLHRRKPRLPLLLQFIRGAVGKKFVIKHYRYGAIKTKYPDMTRIIASARQRKCRDVFKEAVAYAKQVIADPVAKAAWQKRLRRRNGVYNEAVKFSMLKDKREKERAQLLTARAIRLAFRNKEVMEVDEIIYNTGIPCNKQLSEVNNFMDTG